MATSVVSDIDRVAVQMKDAIHPLTLIPPGRIRLWVRVFPVFRRLASLRSALRELRRLTASAAAFETLDDAVPDGLAELMGQLLVVFRLAADNMNSAPMPIVYRFAARQLYRICDEVEDLQETFALASSARFREFVERSLETS